MATQVSTALLPDNSTNASTRAWIQFIHDIFVAAGLIQTADTGQIPSIAALTTPAGASTSLGYEIWRFNDGLAAVYFKIEYGSTSGSANNPGVWLTIGTGSNGAGAITGILYARQQQIFTTANNSNTFTSFGSGGGGSRFALSMFNRSDGTNSTTYWGFGLERSKDTTGADTVEGLNLVIFGSGLAGVRTQLLPFVGSVVAQDTSFRCLCPSAGSTSSNGADVFMYPHYPMITIPKNPGLNFMTYFTADYVPLVSVNPVVIYGANHIMMPTGTNGSGSSVQPANANVYIAMRYE